MRGLADGSGNCGFFSRRWARGGLSPLVSPRAPPCKNRFNTAHPRGHDSNRDAFHRTGLGGPVCVPFRIIFFFLLSPTHSFLHLFPWASGIRGGTLVGPVPCGGRPSVPLHPPPVCPRGLPPFFPSLVGAKGRGKKDIPEKTIPPLPISCHSFSVFFLPLGEDNKSVTCAGHGGRGHHLAKRLPHLVPR